MRLIALLLCVLMPTVAYAQTPESQDPVLMTAINAQASCLHDQALKLDDHRSDASTIADGAMGACHDEIVAVERAAQRTAPMGSSLGETNAALERALRQATIALVLSLRTQHESH